MSAEDEALDDIIVRPGEFGFPATTPCRSRTKSGETALWERDYKGDGLHPGAGVAPRSTDFGVPVIFCNAFFLFDVPPLTLEV